MSESPAAASRVDEGDEEGLRRYLLSFDWPERDEAIEEMIVTGGLPLWREILRIIPPSRPSGTLLELGSPPFHTTLLVEKLRGYAVTTTAGVLDDRRTLRQRLSSRTHAEEHVYDSACFDLEREIFPFADESFDGVLCCEVIEHLMENPVAALAEIHRALRPGGFLVVTTPNAARSGNLLRLWFGGNVFDQYHLGSPLRGSRHSREYTLRELRGLIEGCGFEVDIADGRNLGQIQFTRRTRPFEPVFRLLSKLAVGEHADHLFLRAVKRGRFRWHFPRELFDEGHLRRYLDVRADDVVAGENEEPHTTGNWGPLEMVAGASARSFGPAGADVHLLARRPATRVAVEVVGDGGGEVSATAFAGSNEIGAASGRAPVVLELSLRRPLEVGERVRLHLRAEPRAYLRRAVLS